MLFEQIASNKRKTVFVIGLHLALFLLVGAAIGYTSFHNVSTGILLSILIGGGYVGIMVLQSTNVVMRMNRATEVQNKAEYPLLWNIVEDMAFVAQVPLPKIYIIEDPSPNAFATGFSPQKAAVAVTTGLLARLNREELEGVIAHEFAHIRNYDIRLQTISVAIGAAISLLVQIGPRFLRMDSRRRNKNDKSDGAGELVWMIVSTLAIILGPILATLMRLALSRNREYLADATAVEFTRNPYGLISALKKISSAEPMQSVDSQSAALYITNPTDKKERDSWFSTHPTTSNRIRRLSEM